MGGSVVVGHGVHSVDCHVVQIMGTKTKDRGNELTASSDLGNELHTLSAAAPPYAMPPKNLLPLMTEI